MEYKVTDDEDLAQCCNCGFVDYWDEIPRGRCVFSGDSLTQCPECDDVDGFADYSPERAKRIEEKRKGISI